MVHKCSYIKVLEVFFIEPTTLHFIKGISRQINLAHTSVRNIIKDLVMEGLIVKKKSKPFDGYIANRENEKFIFEKKIYNLLSLNDVKDYIANTLYPKLAVVFGSYSLGEDIETSDIDVLILSKSKKEIDVSKFEKKLKRKINIMYIDDLNKLEKSLLKKIYNGFVLDGGF